mmetsp:Transcript_1623/g.2157  ORF Transcript_1623/g.2157 Transcript_1623/m.2157 type:complete len:113 (-) Transcript_1623:46-384(-)
MTRFDFCQPFLEASLVARKLTLRCPLHFESRPFEKEKLFVKFKTDSSDFGDRKKVKTFCGGERARLISPYFPKFMFHQKFPKSLKDHLLRVRLRRGGAPLVRFVSRKRCEHC